MTPLRFATFGAGFWAQFQLAAWRQVEGATCTAVCDPSRVKAEALAQQLGISKVYDDAAALLTHENLDFVDIISSRESHYPLAKVALERGLPVICQKPMTETWDQARALVQLSRKMSAPLFVHENFRWQAPLRAAKRLLEAGLLGEVFRARVDFISGFPVFANQPSLKTCNPFILMDVGSHVLDVARFLFGEAERVYCQTQRIHTDIAGEDVATVVLATRSGCTVVCHMAYASTPLEREAFPQPTLFIEGTRGSLELVPGCELRLTTKTGTHVSKHPPPCYPWADPDYAVVHASIVPCNADILRHLQGGAAAETTGEDNLETLRLVFAAIDSAARRNAVTVDVL